MNIPRIMIAATRSGSGKTTITCGLIRALTKRALKVNAFKCGPDYIDPMFHSRVLGVPSKNLDTFFTDTITTRELFLTDNDSDISVIEGVMGLYDGLGGTSSEASSYHLATALEAPIVLVIDAHGMGRSILAEIKGFMSYDTNHLIKAVILNRISASFYDTIRPVIEDELGIQVAGYFPKIEEIQLKSRHLGLQLPDEIAGLSGMLDKAADIISDTVDMAALIDIANGAKDIALLHESVRRICNASKNNHFNTTGRHNTEPTKGPRVAIAYDETFCFYYEDNLRLIRDAGLSLIPFSPIHDDKLPEDCSGLILGGGYPENYLKELSSNKSMLESVRGAIYSGIPSLAECGGFMYLHESVSDIEGREYSLAGVIEGSCEYKHKLVRFGYMEIEEKEPVFILASKASQTKNTNIRIKGHEFHYYDSSNNGCDCISHKPTGKRSWESAHVTDNHWWGFAHLYYPSNPEFVRAFAEKVTDYYGKQS